MLSYQFVIVLLQVVLISGLETPERNVKLDALRRNEKVQLTSISQISSLVRQYAHHFQSQRPDYTILALLDLQEVVEEDKEDVCSMFKVSLYEQFYLKHLKTTKYPRDSQPLPASLRKFALAYGMQLVNACRWNIYNELDGQLKGLLTDKDFKPMKAHIHEKSALAKFIGPNRYPDELLLPIDFLGHKLAGEQSEWIMSRGLACSNVMKLKETCERRFRPVYESLMMPVARLERLGFSYRDEQLKRKSSEPEIEVELRKWQRVVFLCELVKNIKLMSLEEAREMDIQRDKMVVLSDDELDQISSLDSQMHLSDGDISVLRYEGAFKVRINDLVLDPTNERLIKAVGSVKTSRSIEKIIRQRRRSNLLGIIGNHLKHFHIHSAVAKLTKYIWRRVDFWTGLKDERKEMVQGLEQELVLNEPKPKKRFTQYVAKGVIVFIKLTLVAAIVLFVVGLFIH